ncbi:MAG: entericidin A/B family lipoprotein [Burkholderiaceae bacterium]
MKLFLAMVVTGLAISACNTMEGVGEDIQAGGKKLESAAEKNR